MKKLEGEMNQTFVSTERETTRGLAAVIHDQVIAGNLSQEVVSTLMLEIQKDMRDSLFVTQEKLFAEIRYVDDEYMEFTKNAKSKNPVDFLEENTQFILTLNRKRKKIFSEYSEEVGRIFNEMLVKYKLV